MRQLTEELRGVKEKNLALMLAGREREKKDIEMQSRLVDAETKLREYKAEKLMGSARATTNKSSIDYELSEIDEYNDDRVNALEK